MAPLPHSYQEFATDWHKKFPRTFDTKVLAFQAKWFNRTGLGDLYEKFVTDEKFRQNVKVSFDVKSGFTRYEGAEALMHHHEAAYDAHMTGVVFLNCLRAKELDEVRQELYRTAAALSDSGKPSSKELKQASVSVRCNPINLEGSFAAAF